MIEELNVLLRKQTPTPPNEWLYQDYTEEGVVKRDFKPFVYLGKNAEPWPECTDQQRRDWEAQHPDQEPEPEVSPDETGETPDGKGEEESSASDQPANVPAEPANEGREAEV